MNEDEFKTTSRFLSQTCCFSGHRKIPREQLPMLIIALKQSIMGAIHQGYLYFGTGGALGFDTLSAQTVLTLKEEYPQIRLILVLPCETQAKGWQQEDVEVYEELKRYADKVVYTSKAYFNGCMLKRNRHLVDHSSLCICYLTNKHSGTGYTVRYAQETGRKIINLAETIT